MVQKAASLQLRCLKGHGGEGSVPGLSPSSWNFLGLRRHNSPMVTRHFHCVMSMLKCPLFLWTPALFD